MTIGIEIKIDVTKIDKARIYQGKKGKYITLTSFVNPDDEDQYGNNGFITHARNKDEDKSVKLPILGNVRVFWKDEQQDHNKQSEYQPTDNGEIPF